MELKKIGVLSLGKIAGLMGLVAGIIAVIILTVIQKIMTGLPTAQLAMSELYSLSLKTALIIPLYYAVIGFIWGTVIALIYNLAAKYIGGIKFELKK